jgi:hypothetical protein
MLQSFPHSCRKYARYAGLFRRLPAAKYGIFGGDWPLPDKYAEYFTVIGQTCREYAE